MAKECGKKEMQVIAELVYKGRRRHVYATFEMDADKPPEHLREINRIYLHDGLCECGCDGERYVFTGLARDVPYTDSEAASPEPLDKDDLAWLAHAQAEAEDHRGAA